MYVHRYHIKLLPYPPIKEELISLANDKVLVLCQIKLMINWLISAKKLNDLDDRMNHDELSMNFLERRETISLIIEIK